MDKADHGLFNEQSSANRRKNEPLASRMRPRDLQEFVGQQHIVGPGKLLNHDVFGSRPTTLFAEAMVDSMLLSIPKDIFMQAVRRSPALTEALFAHYETDLWRMSHQLKNTAGYISVERKLAIKLLKLSQDFGQPAENGMMIPFPLTVTQVGEFVGVPRETASRACKKLGELDLIRYENKHFYITDRERLVSYYRKSGSKKEELL